jgi:hypothetical protein
MRKKLEIVLVMVLALVFASCAPPPPPTTREDIQLMKNLQGTWASDPGKTAPTLKIIGQEVTVNHRSTTPHLDTVDPNKIIQKRMGLDDNKYTVTYEIIDGKMGFRSSATNHKLVFWLTGPDTMEGYRDDFPNNLWKMHRVLEK